jgi:hypothetical protein
VLVLQQCLRVPVVLLWCCCGAAVVLHTHTHADMLTRPCAFSSSLPRCDTLIRLIEKEFEEERGEPGGASKAKAKKAAGGGHSRRS